MSDKMTMREKISDLVEHIEDNFPNGCGHGDCDLHECPAYDGDSDTIEFVVCEMLSAIESFTRGD